MRVLIADDQRSFATVLADMVRHGGHEIVAVVGSGLEAVHAYTLHKPDLVLMDYWMPKLNGATACRHIVAKDPAARVFLVSAWSPYDSTDESGALGFLAKPIDIRRLNAALLSASHTFPIPLPGFPRALTQAPMQQADSGKMAAAASALNMISRIPGSSN